MPRDSLASLVRSFQINITLKYVASAPTDNLLKQEVHMKVLPINGSPHRRLNLYGSERGCGGA